MTHRFARMSPSRLALLGGGVLFLAIVAWRLLSGDAAAPDTAAKSEPRPALTVSLVAPKTADWPQTLAATGNITAWQEAVIGTEIANYRLTAVLVNVGDKVKKGQVLAHIADDEIAATLAQSTAAVAEAEANLAEARFNAERARQLRAAGFFSPQQARQSLTAEQTAQARLDAARARKRADEVRMAQTQVRAPDDGTISSRTATVGSLTQPGQELFRLIRGGRLEWRAEVTGAELASLKPGMPATVTGPTGKTAQGRVRALGPTVDAASRNALIYVDLPAEAAEAGLRAGMFARGDIELGVSPALALPQSAVVTRDGFSYVYTLAAGDKVALTKVGVGRRIGDSIEITNGLAANAHVVAGGGGFLADGDVVRVVGSLKP